METPDFPFQKGVQISMNSRKSDAHTILLFSKTYLSALLGTGYEVLLDMPKPVAYKGSHNASCCYFVFVPCYVSTCHHRIARARVADGGDGLQIWRVDANILNKKSLTADKR
jgi:hypothetical protein